MINILSKSPAIISVLGSLSLLLAIVYEIGYFFSIRFELIQFMSLSDIATSAIMWLPVSVLSIAAGVYWGLGDRIHQRDAIDPLPDGYSKRVLSFYMRNYMTFLASLIFLTSLISALISERDAAKTYFPIVFAFPMFFVIRLWLKHSKTLDEIIQPNIEWVRPVIGLSSGIILIVFGSGYWEGATDIAKKEGNFTIYMPEATPLVLMRTIDRGYLVKPLDNKTIVLIRKNGKQIISYKLPSKDSRSLACKYTGYFCNTRNMEKAKADLVGADSS